MMKKNIILLVPALLLAIAMVSGSSLLIKTTQIENEFMILGLDVIENNSYYADYYANLPGKGLDYTFSFSDKDENLIYEAGPGFSTYSLIDYDKIKNSSRITLKENSRILSERNLSFCNNNYLCEPCKSDDCVNFENELTCNDCRPSYDDGFCNIKNDNTCDPDCISGYWYGGENENEGCAEENFLEQDCSYYHANECKKEEVCSRGEFSIGRSGRVCCDGLCTKSNESAGRDNIIRDDYSDLELDQPEENSSNHSWVFVVLGITILLILVIFFRKNQLITISILGVLLLSSGFLFFRDNDENMVTGNVISESEIVQEICQVGKEYNVPGNILIGIAKFEHGNSYTAPLEHWCNGKVCVSFDGGVGLFQITRNVPKGADSVPPDPQPHIVPCGPNNKMLDVKDIKQNIECGALFLIEKYQYYPAGKEYYCSNQGTSLPPKQVFYTGWEAAIRGYNGWGCTFGGATDAGRARVQNYVEKVMEMANIYKNACENSYSPAPDPDVPDDDEDGAAEDEGGLPEEIVAGKERGYYYLNPSFRVGMPFDMTLYDKTAENAKKLADECEKGYCELYKCWKSECTESIDSETQEISYLCNIDADTQYRTYNYDEKSKKYEEKPIVIKFALELKSIPATNNDECDPIKIEPEIPVAGAGACKDGEIQNGIDVSHHNGDINWGEVKNSGISFAYMKSTEGTNFLDDKFSINARGAKAAGVAAGAYHFVRPDLYDPARGENLPEDEAKYFAQITGPFYKDGTLTLRPAMDLEVAESMPSKELTDWVLKFMETYEAETGITPIIYTNPSFVNHMEPRFDFSKYSLWVANWGVSSPDTDKPWVIWQYSDSGTVSGISTATDLNRNNGKCVDKEIGVPSGNTA